MARPPRPMPARSRQALIAAAADAFVAGGYQRASLNAILRSAGVSKSSAYHHVGDKEALFDLVAREHVELLARHVTLPDPASLTVDQWWEAIDDLLAQLGAAARDEPRTLVAGRLVHLRDAPASPALEEFRGQLSQWGLAMLERGREVRAVDDSLPIALQAALATTVAIEVDRWALQQEASDQAHAAAGGMLRRLLQP